jgi:hypothetical protein
MVYYISMILKFSRIYDIVSLKIDSKCVLYPTILLAYYYGSHYHTLTILQSTLGI